jgi:hypothetical protein
MRANTGTSDYLKGMYVTTSISESNGESIIRTYGLVARDLPEVSMSRHVSSSICESTITTVVREWRNKGKVFYGDHSYSIGPGIFINIHACLDDETIPLIRIRAVPRSNHGQQE